MSLLRTGYMWEEIFAWHDTGTSIGIWPSGGYNQPHQAFESAESKSRFAGLVSVSGLAEQLLRVRAVPTSDEQLLAVHTADYVQRIKDLSAESGGDAGDGATPFGRGTFEIASLAAGGAIAAAEAVLRGEVRNAYALTRPPGHHAEPDRGRGYCIFSNVCIAIEHVRKVFGVERVAIVDYDVHHGNGAQRIYWEDPHVLSISIHQDSLFPQESGGLDEVGGGAGEGKNINVPLPAGSGNGAYLSAMRRVVVPSIQRFKPEIIFVSSGFDPSALDPLGCMSVSSGGFREMAAILQGLADDVCCGKIVFCHEGGYSPVHVPFCGLAVLEELSGVRTDVADPFDISFADSPAHLLLPHQTDVISAAAELAMRV